MGERFVWIDVEKKNQQKSFQLLFDVMEFFSSPEINYSNHSIKISANFSSFAKVSIFFTSVVAFDFCLSKCDSQQNFFCKTCRNVLVLIKNCVSGS